MAFRRGRDICKACICMEVYCSPQRKKGGKDLPAAYTQTTVFTEHSEAWSRQGLAP